ncbi:Ppx/GppA phosphatase family protein [Mucilaginibacter myungsuensis]|uniref:Exopolyphosphatase n=1 Tax=Mucilaginibacter myungsuensis TaxID=649104 RepID=A0A929KRR4_9SPHI|nr:exopolyphosphatase [Mucilaginibacter myungsuensis]MBE9660296.1 exopolyphosphatase [Mucilaginibacter myungsuensis]MDN3600338.1 exopolyphosphatase [Mucilaginibacter myungsuensis]
MNKPVAVMDLGTNTFHLLITTTDPDDPQELLHLFEPVRLGQGGINKGIIQPDAFERGINTMHKFAAEIARFDAGPVKAIATSALRSTSNGKDFIDQVKRDTGIAIEVINGDSEAEYIYQGVKASGCLTDEHTIIIDIGGGSVEFIICDADGIKWKQSFEVGAARLMDKFHQYDPIPADSVVELQEYLDDKLGPLFESAKDYPIAKLIGSSGAFETFAEVLELEKGNEFDLKAIKSMDFDNQDFLELTARLVASTHEERAETKGIIPLRVDMIVVVSLITRYVMDKLDITDVSMSMYSLKEGVLQKLLSQKI